MLARVLVTEPRALVLDEPTSGLDLAARHAFMERVRAVARQGTTVILVTHHLEEIIPEIERVVLLRAGRIAGDGPKAEMLAAGPAVRAVRSAGRGRLRGRLSLRPPATLTGRRMSPRLLVACVALSWGAALAAQQTAQPASPARPARDRPAARLRRRARARLLHGSTTHRDIQPLLAKRCGECHNATKRKGGLALDSYADILDGGKDGPIVQPGHSADSMLIAAPARPRRRRADAQGRRSAARGRDRADRALDRRGRPGDGGRAAGARAVGGAAHAVAPGRPGRAVAGVARSRSIDSSRDYLQRRAKAEPAARSTTRASPAAPTSTSGACCRRRSSCRPSSTIAAPDKRAAAGADAARRRRPLRRALDLVLERPAAQRGRRHLLLGGRRPQEHHAVAAAGAAGRTCPTTASSRR